MIAVVFGVVLQLVAQQESTVVMFEVSKRWKRILLQVVVTLMVLPYLFPLIVMMQGSLAGQGFENYKAWLRCRASPGSSSTAPSFRSA